MDKAAARRNYNRNHAEEPRRVDRVVLGAWLAVFLLIWMLAAVGIYVGIQLFRYVGGLFS